MKALAFQPIREHRLDPPGHPRGVSFDTDGPALGPIRLLDRTTAGFAPRPVEELNALLSYVLGRPLDGARLSQGLSVVSRAINEGNLALAMIATTQLGLPCLEEDEARRAMAVVAMSKAAAGDPKHPGWPAGTEGGRGGQFCPKDESNAEAKGTVEHPLPRLVARRAIRVALRKIHTNTITSSSRARKEISLQSCCIRHGI